jgi:site-specific DNA-methyltransferase (adenine-specific)
LSDAGRAGAPRAASGADSGGPRPRAPRNRTLSLSGGDRERLAARLVRPQARRAAQAASAERQAWPPPSQPESGAPAAADTSAVAPPPAAFALADLLDRTLCADIFEVLDLLPKAFADLLFLDPPYNLDKDFGGLRFARRDGDAYLAWLRSWLPRLVPALKPGASIYLCGDWESSGALQTALSEVAVVRNRITWQREKGRGAQANWKASSEDIWFATLSDDYWFDVEAVKQRRRVLAPYRAEGRPKDWEETSDGRFRLTHPGNFWDDLSVPFWSMPENTDHPTQKPEKLLAKLILASCPPGGLVLDPFLGSGTSAVVARKLGRRHVGIEINEEYCLWAEKRLELALGDRTIQGYEDGIFWERNARKAKD